MRSLGLSMALLIFLAVADVAPPAPRSTGSPGEMAAAALATRSTASPSRTDDCLCASGANGGNSAEVSPPANRDLPSLPTLDDFSYDDRAHWHAHGKKMCQSGCAVSNHPTLDLSPAEFRRLTAEYAASPASESGPAFEALLYYGKQTRDLLARDGASPLDAEHVRRLTGELSRTHARVSFRITDADGRRRVWLPPTRVPLDRRHVFTMETVDLQPLVTSGTVKRVGQDYLWVRL